MRQRSVRINPDPVDCETARQLGLAVDGIRHAAVTARPTRIVDGNPQASSQRCTEHGHFRSMDGHRGERQRADRSVCRFEIDLVLERANGFVRRKIELDEHDRALSRLDRARCRRRRRAPHAFHSTGQIVARIRRYWPRAHGVRDADVLQCQRLIVEVREMKFVGDELAPFAPYRHRRNGYVDFERLARRLLRERFGRKATQHHQTEPCLVMHLNLPAIASASFLRICPLRRTARFASLLPQIASSTAA